MDEPILAAGTVLWRDGPGRAEVALIHRPRHDDWSFPKGKLDGGEHVLRAVVRETAEETGIVPLLGRRLPTSTYLYDDRVKHVHYWSARETSQATVHTVPNNEVDALEWLPVREAAERLTYERDIDLLSVFDRGPRHTWPLVILRHGSAGEKLERREDDMLRPLDGEGRRQAVELGELLSVYGPALPIGSGTARCLETLVPYAGRTGDRITSDPAFTLGETTGPRATGRLMELVAARVPAIICTHGEIVTDLITALCGKLGQDLPDDTSLGKADFWVAHLSGGAPSVAALERHGL